MANEPRNRRYLDNAATTFPKPAAVADAIQHYMANIGASAGRGSYRESLDSQRVLDDCRYAIRKLFHAAPGDHVIFTLNGTDALNLALKSTVRPGDHVVTTAMDHNSVLRPLSALQEQIGVEWDAVSVPPDTTLLDPEAIEDAIRPNTSLIVVNHASNVTGALQPIREVVRLAHEHGVPVLVDAAQTAGHVPIDLGETEIDFLACPGHKGLLGPLGTGVLVIRESMIDRMRTVREGGTGSASELPVQPSELPDRFEAGSHNAVGIAGLLAAVRWLLDRDVALQRKHEVTLAKKMIERLREAEGVQWFGPGNVEQRVGVFSVRIEGIDPVDLSAQLESRFDLLTRSGLHCAPFAHRTIGTYDRGGTTRIAFGVFNKLDDVHAVADALCEVAESARCVPADVRA